MLYSFDFIEGFAKRVGVVILSLRKISKLRLFS